MPRKVDISTVSVNTNMPEAESAMWIGWGCLPRHPQRPPSCRSSMNESYFPLKRWPVYIVRGNGMKLYHACRMPMLCDLIPLSIYHNREQMVMTAWVPKSCGPGTIFHKRLFQNYTERSYLAKACGLLEPYSLSYGLSRFFVKMCLGQVLFHELYIGQCPKCGQWLNQWDGDNIHQCRVSSK